MAVSVDSVLASNLWTPLVSGAAETLLTSNGNGFLYVIRTSLPSPDLTVGHVVDGFTNEPVVTKAGETLYARARFGAVTLVATSDA